MSRSLSENPSSDADRRASQPVESTAILRKAPRTLYDLILDRYDLDGVELDRKLIRVRGDLPPHAATLATRARVSSGNAEFGGRLASAVPVDPGTAGRPVSRSTPADAPSETQGAEVRPGWHNARPKEKPWRFDEDDTRRAAPPPRRARRAREEWNERGF